MMNNIERQSGFYWVKRNGLNWIIAEYFLTCDVWYLAGDAGKYYDEDFDEIHERPITMGMSV